MSVAFGKIDGVRKVDVSLEGGTVTLDLDPGNKLTLRRVHELIRKNGFTPRDAEVKVDGKVTERSGKAALSVTGTSEVLVVAGIARRTAGETISVTGRVREPDASGKLEMDLSGIEPETSRVRF